MSREKFVDFITLVPDTKLHTATLRERPLYDFYIAQVTALFYPGRAQNLPGPKVAAGHRTRKTFYFCITPTRSARSLPARCRLLNEHLSLQGDTSWAISYRATFLVLYYAPWYRARARAHSFGMILPRFSDAFMQMHACKKILLTELARIAPVEIPRIFIEWIYGATRVSDFFRNLKKSLFLR